MTAVDRRQFLSTTATALGSAALASAQHDPVRVAIIGMGGRGMDLMKEFSQVPAVQIGAVVDPDGNRAEQAAGWIFQNNGNRPKVESDMRRVFEDDSIGAVIIATTNHWHALTAIWAMQAGKHVYCEKPVSHDIFEGRQLVAAARKYKRIVQGGTQRRSDGRFRRAVQLLHDEAIGDIYLAKWFFPGKRDSIGFKPEEPPPNWLNWDLWLGPAPEQPYHANLVHYNWHWFWDFGNGELGNNGIHLVDISRWGMRKELPARVSSWGGRFGYKDQAQTPNTQNVRWEYPDGTAIVGEIRGLYTAEPMSWDFFGTKGHLHIAADGQCEITLGRNKQPEPPVEPLPAVNHYANWVEAIRANDRSLLHAEIRETTLSTALCHLGNIAYRVGHELTFDPAGEHFRDCAEANALLKRSGRPPYVIPDEVEPETHCTRMMAMSRGSGDHIQPRSPQSPPVYGTRSLRYNSPKPLNFIHRGVMSMQKMWRVFPLAAILVSLLACGEAPPPLEEKVEVPAAPPTMAAQLIASDPSWGNTEGPAVDSKGTLYFTSRGTYKGIVSWTEKDGAQQYLAVATMAGPGSLWVDDQDNIFLTATDERKILKVTPDKKVSTVAENFEVDAAAEKGPNDLVVAKNGTVYFTDPKGYYGDAPNGTVYMTAADGKTTVFSDAVTGPNGIILSADEKTLYVAHNVAKTTSKIHAWKLNEDGSAGEMSEMATVEPCVADGMAVDQNGNIWLTCYSFGTAHLVTPEGKIIQTVTTEQKALTNCKFGRGADNHSLYLTSSDMERVTGYIYRATVETPGVR